MINSFNHSITDVKHPILVDRRYRITKLLAANDFYLTCLCQDLHQQYVTKTIKLYKPDSKIQEEQAKALYETLNRITSANLVPIVDFGKSEEFIYIVSNCMQLSPLSQKNNKLELDEDFIIKILDQSVKVIKSAHRNNIVGCNLKIENFFFTDLEEVVINDLLTPVHKSISNSLITYEFEKSGKSAPEDDFFNLGLIFYNLLTGQKLEDLYDQESFKSEYSKNSIPKISDYNSKISQWLSELIMAMIHPNPKRRLTNPDNISKFLYERISAQQMRSVKNQQKSVHLSEIKKILVAAEQVPVLELDKKPSKFKKLGAFVSKSKKWLKRNRA